MIKKIADSLNLQLNQVKNTIELLDSENTVPFIARYRKEVTGSLDEDQIRNIQDRIRYLRNISERKQTVLKSIEEQGKLTPELQDKIMDAEKLQELEDLYLPYKPKRRTRATIAKEKGLEPLADLILEQNIVDGDIYEIAGSYINEEKGITTADDALAGARDIIAEHISENADIRKSIREKTLKTGLIASESLDPKAVQDYEIYTKFEESIKTIPPHRILALNRGEHEHMLRVWINVEIEELHSSMMQVILTNPCSIFKEQLETAIQDAYQRLIAPAIQREIRRVLSDKADDHAISVFAKNLKALLLSPPLHGKMIMGIDPGFRSGCKVAVIDTTGKYLKGETIYPHPPQKQLDQSKKILKELMETYKVNIIAIGNGTASRETEQLVSELISEYDKEILYTIVNEAGASVYSASPVAKQEFPDLDASMRGNISIARRLLDPLSELVKIDPKSIGVGLYQHDVDQNKLTDSLHQVVESCVNSVGVDLNTASASLLKYVAGINSRIADNIIKFRESEEKFACREDLKKVQGLGEHTFLQAAGFLRISNSDFFLDSTAVHPESYLVAQKLLDHFQVSVSDIRSNSTLFYQKMKTTRESMNELAKLCGCGQETLSDIIDCLEKPNRDPRENMPKPILRSDILSMEDLQEGMVLKGTVRNVVDFGAFVDIGVKQDGLVHLSQIARRYIKHPLDILKVGDVIDVKILSIDITRGRIGLSMLLDMDNP
ncbi:Tex family protein [bacterium]